MAEPHRFELPQALLDVAAARLIEAEVAAAALAELVALHPEHAAALRALARRLSGADRLLDEAFAAPRPVFDGYRILQQLGSGAFGVVYLCEQLEPIRRQVAIKVLRPGAGDSGTLQRFAAEQQFLARMQHPAIAQIFDAGLLPDGRPWFVMEYVAGVPITDYCARVNLSIEERLRLFVRLCHGVQHAHEHGVLHRDLKPANILVVERGSDREPKIVDFGIARALWSPVEPGAQRTETGRVVGTPGYMSPEQRRGAIDGLDARSDVWSLGVVLYELLTGELPWKQRVETTSGDESDPLRPSDRVAARRAPGTTTSQELRRVVRSRVAELRGDLDWIVLKALSRDREQRYASPHALADDLARRLRGEAVLAGPPSLRYRMGRMVRRRRGLFVASGFMLAIMLGAVWLVGRYRGEVAARSDEAEQAVSRLLARANDPALVTVPGSAAVRKALCEDALLFYQRFLDRAPADRATEEGRARALWTLSQVHWLLGQFGESERVAREASAAASKLLAAVPGHVVYRGLLVNAERNVGRAISTQGREAAARPHFERAVELCEQNLAEQAPFAGALLARALIELVSTLDDEASAARREQLLQRALVAHGAHMARHPDDHDEVELPLIVHVQLSQLAARRGDLAAVRSSVAAAETVLTASPSLAPASTALLHAVAAELALVDGDRAAAEQRRTRAIAACDAQLAREPASPHSFASGSQVLARLTAIDAGEPELARRQRTDREAVAWCERWVEQFPQDPRAIRVMAGFALRIVFTQVTAGRRSEAAQAEALARRMHALMDAAMAVQPDEGEPLLVNVRGHLGLVADSIGCDDRRNIWEAAAAALRSPEGARTAPQTAATYGLRIAACRVADGRAAEALAMLDDVERWLETLDAHSGAYTVYAPATERLRALLSVQRADWASGAAFAERALIRAAGWRAAFAAADAMSRVWRGARAAGVDAAGWRDRAVELCEQARDLLQPMVEGNRADPWTALPFGKAGVLLALAQADRGIAPHVGLARDLEQLTAWRDEACIDEWDEELYRAGLRLAGR